MPTKKRVQLSIKLDPIHDLDIIEYMAKRATQPTIKALIRNQIYLETGVTDGRKKGNGGRSAGSTPRNGEAGESTTCQA